ncbi:MAG: 50S ribosomal protein L10 [Candidatus Micrarchaeota archaeon]
MAKPKGSKKIEGKKERPAIAKKKAKVLEVSQKLKGSKTVALLNVRNLPDKILQKARKQLRGKAEFMMAKNTVIKRSLQASDAKELEALVDSPSVIVVSKGMSAYSIFKHFKDNKMRVAAKPGQVAEQDIIVPAGETDLPPGPALSELKAGKVNAMIKAGKIAIQKDSLVAKKGEKIEDAVCKALQKLNIFPFTAGINMLAGVEDGVLYQASVLDIDEAGLTMGLKASIADSFNMSVNCSYPTEMNAEHLLASSYAQSRALVDVTGAYSSAHMELLLAPAMRMAEVLGGKVGTNEAPQPEGGAQESAPADRKEEAEAEQTPAEAKNEKTEAGQKPAEGDKKE